MTAAAPALPRRLSGIIRATGNILRKKRVVKWARWSHIYLSMSLRDPVLLCGDGTDSESSGLVCQPAEDDGL